MRCEEYQAKISEFIDGELTDEETTTLFNHLASCQACRSTLAAMLRLRQSLVVIPRPVVRPELDARVHGISAHRQPGNARLRSWSSRLWQNRVRLPMPALATLVLVALLSSASLLVSWLHSREQTRQETPQVLYIIGLEPVEVQGSMAASSRPNQ